MNPAKELPFVFDLGQSSIETFFTWYDKNKDLIESKLLEVGGVLFRGLPIDSMQSFERVLEHISSGSMDYRDGNSPRTKLSSKVYTSTEYDKDHKIILHSELSYSHRWPERLFFCCITPPTSGGETPLADSRDILTAMPQEVIFEMETKGLRYIRNIHGGSGVSGKSWQQTFETESRDDVEAYCKEHDTEFEWREDGSLRLTQKRRGIIQHPKSGDKVWFNQADQFHPSHMDIEIYETLLMLYNNEEDLPTYVTYGDGSKISNETIALVRKVVDEHTVAKPWQQGDLLMVDNLLVMHGRMPFKGERKILVSMA